MGKTQQRTVVAGEGRVVDNLKAFLARFEGFKQQQIQALKPVQDFLIKFTAGRDGLIKQEQEWEATVAPHFNVFQTLRIERRETKLHSRFLAELLDPNGCHGQQDYFLKLFLTKVLDLCKPALLVGRSEWKVKTEDAVNAEDRLDIVLRCQARGFIIVIENKIDAREGPEQLRRYADWLKGQKRLFPVQHLVFLTITGREPDTVAPNACVRLSYREDIRNWLAFASEGIQATPVRCAVAQYLRTVEFL